MDDSHCIGGLSELLCTRSQGQCSCRSDHCQSQNLGSQPLSLPRVKDHIYSHNHNKRNMAVMLGTVGYVCDLFNLPFHAMRVGWVVIMLNMK